MPSRSNKPPSLTLTVCTLLTLSAISPLPTPVFATPLFDRSPSLHDIEWASTAKMGQNPVIGLGLGLDLDHEFDPDARGATDEEIVTVMDGVLPEYPTSWHKESPRVTSQQTDSPSIVIGHEPVASDVWEDRPAESDEQDIAGQAISRPLSSLFTSLKLWGLTKRDSPSSESSTLPTIPTSAIAMSAPFPSPLDSSLSYSLRNSCVAFLTAVMTSEKMGGSGQGAATTVSKGSTGKGSCKPAGLLMATSSGWASLLRQPSEMNAALSQICHPSDADVSQDCSAYFNQMGKDMVKQENCYDDLNEGNAVALQAYDGTPTLVTLPLPARDLTVQTNLSGLIHYDMMQQAACLPDDSTGTYCYLEAMTASTPDDGYLWTLPGGNQLPSTTKPSCSSCSKSLLTLFSNTVANTTSSVKTKFGPSFSTALGNATNLVDNACGNGFVNVEALGSTSGASRSSTITISGVGVGLAVLGVALSCI